MSLETPDNIQRSPLSPTDIEGIDMKGKPRTNHQMTDGTVFYGSEEEYTEELVARREQAKM
jgi:hypothetical protein